HWPAPGDQVALRVFVRAAERCLRLRTGVAEDRSLLAPNGLRYCTRHESNASPENSRMRHTPSCTAIVTRDAGHRVTVASSTASDAATTSHVWRQPERGTVPVTRGFLERTTGFEPATPTLARLCSTN